MCRYFPQCEFSVRGSFLRICRIFLSVFAIECEERPQPTELKPVEFRLFIARVLWEQDPPTNTPAHPTPPPQDCAHGTLLSRCKLLWTVISCTQDWWSLLLCYIFVCCFIFACAKQFFYGFIIAVHYFSLSSSSYYIIILLHWFYDMFKNMISSASLQFKNALIWLSSKDFIISF